MTADAQLWGLAGRRMTAAGEGTPEMWRAASLVPCPDGQGLGLVLGSLSGQIDELLAAPIFVAHPCVGQSSGDLQQLPVSVVWEVLLPMLFAAERQSEALIRINLAEEQLKYPRRADQFAEVAGAVAAAAAKLGAQLGIRTRIEIEDRPPASPPAIPASMLYGIFTPFQPEIDHPRGFRNESDILIAFTWYLARYRDLPVDACVIEGAHMVGAVRAALGVDARYLATVGLPAPSGRPCLVQDAPVGERVVMADIENLPLNWWPEEVVLHKFGRGLRELALDFRAGLNS